MVPEGELVVTIHWDGARVRCASVRSTRPLAVPRVLVGRTTREAAELVPLLFSVCAHAQGTAAACALEAANGRPTPAATLRRHDLAVVLEALQEDLRRLLIDLPAAAGIAGNVAAVARARRAIAPLLAAARGDIAPGDMAKLGAALLPLVDTDLLGRPAAAFVAIDAARGFVDWARSSSTPVATVVRHAFDIAPGLGISDVRPMPPASQASLGAAVLVALDAEPGFARSPHWHGTPVETGALARRARHPGLRAFIAEHGNGVAARLIARLLGVVQAIVALAGGEPEPRVAAWSPRPGEGAASVDTARGLLVHRARVTADRVTEYAIVAPTEWNFHPQGALVRGLAGLVAGDERALAHGANLVVQALDPCVAYSVEIGRA